MKGIIVPIAINTLKNKDRLLLDNSPSLFSIILSLKNNKIKLTKKKYSESEFSLF